MERLVGSRILVTGGTGFIGGHLVEELLQTKATIFVPYIEIHPKSTFALNNLSKKVTLLNLNITDREKTLTLIKRHNIDFIFHLAAQTLVTKAIKNPFETLQTNIIGTVNILEAARTIKKVKGVIIASSDKAYGKTKQAYKEDAPLKGDHPYDVSKSSADLISQMYFKTYKTPVVITRFGNVYGEGDLHFDRIIPGICESIVKRKTFEIRSDGTYVRDYIYVKDVVRGYLMLLKNLDKIKGEAFNFSSNDTLSVLDVVRKAERALNVEISYSILNTAQNEIPYQHLNHQKIQKLGWKPRYTLSQTLPRILAWYKKVV